MDFLSSGMVAQSKCYFSLKSFSNICEGHLCYGLKKGLSTSKTGVKLLPSVFGSFINLWLSIAISQLSLAALNFADLARSTPHRYLVSVCSTRQAQGLVKKSRPGPALQRLPISEKTALRASGARMESLLKGYRIITLRRDALLRALPYGNLTRSNGSRPRRIKLQKGSHVLIGFFRLVQGFLVPSPIVRVTSAMNLILRKVGRGQVASPNIMA